MRYLTKEWYELCQKCSYHLLLKINKKAEVFSDEFYRELYQRKLNAHLKLGKKISTLTVDDVFGVETADPNFTVNVEDDSLTPEERTKIEENIKKLILEKREAYSPTAYDEAALTGQFQANHEIHIELLKKDLPSGILDALADIRVLALNVASKKVKQEIRSWCRKNEKQIKATQKVYHDILSNNAKQIGSGIVDKFSFHDSKIVSSEIIGNDFVITLDPSGFTEVNTVIFRDSRIIEQDGVLEGACWLYEEIYPVDGGNEYHMLVQCTNGLLAYLTIQAASVEFKVNA